ncbi:hypothetical protein DIPPA_29746 [Diplonema papillatum]|nr:hypothetical protein DIPPA_29746 [Diplonema papillatum]
MQWKDGNVAYHLANKFRDRVPLHRCDALRNAVAEARAQGAFIGPKAAAAQMILLTRWHLPHEALHVYKQTKRRGLPVRAAGYDALLRGFAAAGDLPMFRWVWKTMASDGYQPSAYAYAAALLLCHKKQDATAAAAVWRDVPPRWKAGKDGCPLPPEQLRHHAILASPSVRAAARFLRGAEPGSPRDEAWTPLDVEAFVQVAISSQDERGLRRVLRRARREGLPLSDVAFATLISACAETGKLSAGIRWLERRYSSQTPNSVSPPLKERLTSAVLTLCTAGTEEQRCIAAKRSRGPAGGTTMATWVAIAEAAYTSSDSYKLRTHEGLMRVYSNARLQKRADAFYSYLRRRHTRLSEDTLDAHLLATL